MIPVTIMKGRKVLVFGLGESGLATAAALKAGGADVLVFDDNQDRCQQAEMQGFNVDDLRDVDFAQYDALVLSPGVPLTHPHPHWSVELALQAGVEIIGDVELFVRERRVHAPSSTFVAITGTNGKSTTTVLISHILAQAGYAVQMGGNIGRAVLTLDELSNELIYVVECSSYQIDLAPSLDPTIGVHLNLSADHLDRHGTLEHYAEVKARLVKGSGHAVVGIDDDLSQQIAEQLLEVGQEVDRVTLRSKTEAEIIGLNTKICSDDHDVADIDGIVSLRGSHNLQNAVVAWAVCHQVGLSDADIQAGFETFPGLPHRMEQVAEHKGVIFINDSKATNADAAARALASFDRIFWIAGGRAKDGGIESLNHFFPKIVHTFLIGESADDFAATLKDEGAVTISGTLEKACEDAVQLALSDDGKTDGGKTAVLLSPACASWDQFASFGERGDIFRQTIKIILNQS